ncbi:MAG: ABC transporter permease [Acidimicrobiia bacterium]|nr:ABC transporter permease [Acidimicrobiia bacterium]
MAETLTIGQAIEVESATGVVDDGRSSNKLGLSFWIAVGVLGLVVGGCLLEPFLPLPDFRLPAPGVGSKQQLFSAEHWLGTDNLGRDNLSRILHGGRTSLFIALSVTTLGFIGGGLVGLLAGYFRGWVERILMAIVDIFLAFPALVFALALVSIIAGEEGATVSSVIISLSVLSVSPLARITRATTLQFAQREFVTAAKSQGARHTRIIMKEILPNVLPPMASFALVVVAIVIVAEAALSFVGAGLPDIDYPTWGNMIAAGQASPNALRDHGSVALTPAAVLFVTVLSLNLIGDKLRQRFDVKESGV